VVSPKLSRSDLVQAGLSERVAKLSHPFFSLHLGVAKVPRCNLFQNYRMALTPRRDLCHTHRYDIYMGATSCTVLYTLSPHGGHRP
jgi:hypothetical protein